MLVPSCHRRRREARDSQEVGRDGLGFPAVVEGPGAGTDLGWGERCGVVLAGAEVGAFFADLFVDFDQGGEAFDVPDFGFGQDGQERVDGFQESFSAPSQGLNSPCSRVR
jgi:hypothetical protein